MLFMFLDLLTVLHLLHTSVAPHLLRTSVVLILVPHRDENPDLAHLVARKRETFLNRVMLISALLHNFSSYARALSYFYSMRSVSFSNAFELYDIASWTIKTTKPVIEGLQ